MARRDLLPGVAADACPPAIVADSRREIVRARRRAAFRDAANLFMIGSVDWLFTNWPATRVPLLSRDESALLVIVLNALVIAYLIVSRLLPRMAARRIATTWCLRERARFFQRPL
jgi:hypothetical protein